MMLPARYRSMEHFIDEMEQCLVWAIEDLLDADLPLSDIAVTLDGAMSLLYPASHQERWTFLPNELKELLIQTAYDTMRLKPTQEDLSLIEVDRVLDYIHQEF